MEQRISFITLGVADLARSRAFYEALGWKVRLSGSDEIVFFQAGGLILGLYPRHLLAEDAGLPDAPRAPFGGIAIAHNGRSQADVDAIYAEALAAGATPLKAPAKVFWGGYSGYFADLDGHPWELAYNPFLPLADDGSVLPKA